MNTNQKELLMSYIKSNIAPILVDFINGANIPNSVIIPANCSMQELIGSYIATEYVCPNWFNELNEGKSILVIDKIDSVSKEEQKKFIEILKYRQVSTFELPKNIVIIVTANVINQNTIDEEIYSLMAHIG